MTVFRLTNSLILLVFGLGSILAGCQTSSATPVSPPESSHVRMDSVLNRVTWGINSTTYHSASALGLAAYLHRQLHPGPEVLPDSVRQQINAMAISRYPVEQLATEIMKRRKTIKEIVNNEEKKKAQQEYQHEMNRLARESAARFLLRALYSPNQLQEQMTWFWMNHFNVYQGKHALRALVGDYEEQAIRPHALGKFRDLLAATMRHPAMLIYLDNARNAAHHLNENYARELMELHTLGVNGDYSQKDVQELARILTGLGINAGTAMPRVRRTLQDQYVRHGLFEFNPNRHDYGDKVFLGQPLHGRGLAEVDEAIDRLSRAPATARFISRKLAIYFVSDDPPASLVNAMADTFQHSDGDIAATLTTLFNSPEFAQSLGHKFKDPVHYLVSALRLAYDDKPILNANPLMNWLRRMGEPLYGRQTPDGYPMIASAWASPGQMATRFDAAKAIGSGSAGLFKTNGPRPREQAAFPQLANALYYQVMQKSLSPATRQALDKATSPQEWNTFLLASPELMYR